MWSVFVVTTGVKSQILTLQKRHELEGAPDPFPTLNDSPAKPRANPPTQPQVDTASQLAFPSLAPSVPAAASAKPAWGTSTGPRIKPAASKQPLASDSFTLTDIELSSNRDGKHTTVGEIIKGVMGKYKVKIEASSNRTTRQTTFHMKADSQKDLAKARRDLLSSLSPIVRRIQPLSYYLAHIYSNADCHDH
jgi:hypothetical protein